MQGSVQEPLDPQPCKTSSQKRIGPDRGADVGQRGGQEDRSGGLRGRPTRDVRYPRVQRRCRMTRPSVIYHGSREPERRDPCTIGDDTDLPAEVSDGIASIFLHALAARSPVRALRRRMHWADRRGRRGPVRRPRFRDQSESGAGGPERGVRFARRGLLRRLRLQRHGSPVGAGRGPPAGPPPGASESSSRRVRRRGP